MISSGESLFDATKKGKHKHHAMHNDSLKSWREINMSRRMKTVMQAFVYNGCLTDRQARDVLGFDDMNSVRPAITRLCDMGLLIERGQIRCQTTGKTVRVCSPRAYEKRVRK